MMEHKVTEQERFDALQQAMLVGHCAESRAAIHNTHGNLARMMAVYWHYIRECVRKDFPNLQQLRTYFGTAVQPYGAGIDFKGDWQATKYMMFAGDSEVQTTLSSCHVHQCWLRHNSKLVVCLTEYSYLHVDCFEDTELVVNAASEHSTCHVRLYGNSKITLQGHTERIKVERMHMPTYPANQ